MTNENKWFIYENDVYGVNGLLDFPSKQKLADYINSDSFETDREIEDFDDQGRAALLASTARFLSGELDSHSYGEEVSDTLEKYESEIDELIIEDFESLRAGTTDFSKEVIEIFCERSQIEHVDKIADDLALQYMEFFDEAHEHWVG